MQVAFRVALLSTTPEAAHRLRAAVRPRASVVDLPDGESVLTAVLARDVDLTVLELRGPRARDVVRVLRQLRESVPDHPVVAWCDLRTIEVPMLLEVAQLGVVDLLRGDADDLRHVFGRTFASALQRTVSGRITEALGDVVPVPLRPVFEYALERVGEPLDRDDIAAAFGVSRRTLYNRLTSAGLPSAGLFITWTRVLVAAALLDQPGYSLDQVAAQLNLGSSAALNNLILRYTGQRAGPLRRAGALQAVAETLRESVRAARLAQQELARAEAAGAGDSRA